MTLAEKSYTACVAVVAAFFGFLSVLYLLSPRPKPNPYIDFYYIAGTVVLTVFLTLAATIAWNLYLRTLRAVPTIIQAIALSLMFYTLPLGLWGCLLLFCRYRRAKAPLLVTRS